MSYNIDTWKTKKLEKLFIPIKAFYEAERKDFHPSQPKIVNFETMGVVLECIEGTVKGILADGKLCVSELNIYGEGSGSFRHYVLDNALKQSTGELEAVLVWEGGDSITKFKVENGVITESDYEL